MAKRICLMTFYPTDCKDDCFNCECGGAEATKDMYVSINDVQRVCTITDGVADTDDGKYIAEVIRNNLEHMVISLANVQSINKWINAKEKKPNAYEDVLVLFEYENYGRDFTTSLKIGVAHYVMGKWYGNDLYKYPKSKVIYWQPSYEEDN